MGLTRVQRYCAACDIYKTSHARGSNTRGVGKLTTFVKQRTICQNLYKPDA